MFQLKQLLYIRCVEISHTKQEGNKAAHGFTQHAQFIDGFITWIEETPSIVESVINSVVIISISSKAMGRKSSKFLCH